MARRAAIESPCNSVCAIDAASGLCRGCLRTLDEIARWGLADDAQRRAILAAVAIRTATRDDTNVA